MPLVKTVFGKERMRARHTPADARRQHEQAPGPARRRARRSLPRTGRALAKAALLVAIALSTVGCSGGAQGLGSGDAGDTGGQTSGPAFARPDLALSPFNAEAALDCNGALIDTSHLAQGYVAVSATSPSRLKFQVASDDGNLVYNFDLPGDGTPISCPLTMGDGSYTFTVWENTSGQSYVSLGEAPSQQVSLADEFQPFIRPSTYCDYNAQSKSTQLANELCADAQNQGDALRAIYSWIVDNVAYDEGKAAQLANATGYVPSPDATIDAGSGICFDYASLAAAMLRSQGIPCKIITGYVSPDNIYHAWNMVYIDGTWVDARIDVKQGTWTRIDTTFAAGSGSSYVGDGASYTDQYTY